MTVDASLRGEPNPTAERERPLGLRRGLPLNRLLWVFVMNWGQSGISGVVTIVLAAIVGPHDYGLLAMAMIYVVFIQLFLEQGISTALIQREELEDEDLDSAFWMNIAGCFLLAGASVALSGWWARANHTPELQAVINVLSITIVIRGLTIVQASVLQHQLSFKKLALRSNGAAILGGACGLAVALWGGGVWALVSQQLGMAFGSLVLLWSLSTWRPRFRFSWPHARRLFGFSGFVFVGNLGTFIVNRADALLIGLFFGPLAVGLYRLADRIVEMGVTFGTRPVRIFSLSYFSRLQSNPDALRKSVQSCLRLTAVATVPTMLALAVCSKYVMAAFGPSWRPAANALLLLSLVGIAKAMILFTGPLLFAVGKPRFRAVMVWLFAALSAAAFAATGLAFRGSAVGEQVLRMAESRALLFVVVFTPVSLMVVSMISGLSVRKMLTGLVSPTAAGAAAVLGVVGVRSSGALNTVPPTAALVVVAMTAAVLATGTLLLLEPRVREVSLTSWREVRRRLGSARGLARGSA